GRRRSGPGRQGPGCDRGRFAARFAHRPDRSDEHSRRGVAAPAAAAGRKRLGIARRFHGVTPKVLLSWSGGKDAAWALHVLRQRDDVEVVGLLTTITEGFERIAMQGIRVEVLRAQAEAAGLPVIESRMPRRADNAVY